uniref:Ion channel putative n=1 Tax=Albugo laibachii Nc14 TaxID=890382 RepID=F0W9V2_9STRA|nr:ion channel putative [Albugo laibachii Nc14]|eukprot:CCA17920.1 ion channel putative [Albugo laibachii Nc14]
MQPDQWDNFPSVRNPPDSGSDGTNDMVEEPIKTQRVKRQRQHKNTSSAVSYSCKSSVPALKSSMGMNTNLLNCIGSKGSYELFQNMDSLCKYNSVTSCTQTSSSTITSASSDLGDRSINVETQRSAPLQLDSIQLRKLERENKFLHESTRAKRAKPDAPKFLLLLYEILQTENENVIKWAEDGLSLQILDPSTVTEEILPKYFNHTNFHSFQRQLNYFGFRKWTKSKTDICTFSHPHFRQNQPEMLQLIKRKKAPRRSGVPAPLMKGMEVASDRTSCAESLHHPKYPLFATESKSRSLPGQEPTGKSKYEQCCESRSLTSVPIGSIIPTGSRRLLPISPSGKRQLASHETNDLVPSFHSEMKRPLSSGHPLPSIQNGSPSRSCELGRDSLYIHSNRMPKDVNNVISPLAATGLQKIAKKKKDTSPQDAHTRVRFGDRNTTLMGFYPPPSVGPLNGFMSETLRTSALPIYQSNKFLPTLDIVRKRIMHRQNQDSSGNPLGSSRKEDAPQGRSKSDIPDASYDKLAAISDSAFTKSSGVDDRAQYAESTDPVDLLLRIKKCHSVLSPAPSTHPTKADSSVEPARSQSDTSQIHRQSDDATSDLTELHNFLLRQSLYTNRLEAQLKLALEENESLRNALDTKAREMEGMHQEQLENTSTGALVMKAATQRVIPVASTLESALNSDEADLQDEVHTFLVDSGPKTKQLPPLTQSLPEFAPIVIKPRATPLAHGKTGQSFSLRRVLTSRRYSDSASDIRIQYLRSARKPPQVASKHSLMDRLAYRVDLIITSRRGQTMSLTAAGLVLIVLGGLILAVVQPHEAVNETLWQSWTFLADSGSHTNLSRERVRVIGAITTIIGILYFSVIMGFVVDGIRDKMDSLKKGKSRVAEDGHTLMLGWTDKSVSFIRQICLANESEHGGTIVVLAEVEKEDLEAELSSHLKSEDLRGTRVIFRTGTSLLSVDLIKVAAHRAKSIVIMAQTSGEADRSDASVLRTVLSLKTIPQLSGHIVAELRDIDNEPLVKLVGSNQVEILVSHDVIGRLVLMSARSPGLAGVFTSLLGFEGCEFYVKHWPECVGVRFGDLVERFPDAIPLGIKNAQGQVFLHPGFDVIVQELDQIIVLAEDDDTYQACDPLPVDIGELPDSKSKPQINEKILMCGWRRDIRDMIQLLDSLVTPRTELHMLCEEPIHLRSQLLQDGGLKVKDLRNLRLFHHFGNTAVRRHLENLPLDMFTSMMILADQSRETDIMHSDSHSLASLLLIRDLQNRLFEQKYSKSQQMIPKHKRPRVACKCISEILDPRTQKTISTSSTILELSEFIQSNELVSCILAMISESRDVRVILDELLGPQGAFFEIEPSSRYCLQSEEVTFWQLAKRAMLKGDILCGYQYHAAKEETILNPNNKMTPRTWEEIDLIVLQSERKEEGESRVGSVDVEQVEKQRQSEVVRSHARKAEEMQNAKLCDRVKDVIEVYTGAQKNDGSFGGERAGVDREEVIQTLVEVVTVLLDVVMQRERVKFQDQRRHFARQIAYIDHVDVRKMMESEAEEFKNQGNKLYAKGSYREARDLYSKAIDLAPTIVSYYGNRAAASFMLDDHKEAIADCNRAILFDSTFSKGYVRKAKAQIALGDIEGANKTFQTGLTKCPNNAALHSEKQQLEVAKEKMNRGLEHLKAARYGQAVLCLDGALQILRCSTDLKMKRAEALIGCERYDEAFASLTQLMRANTSSSDILYLRARCLYFQGEFTNAVKHLQQALRSDPDNQTFMKEMKKIRKLESSKENANAAFKAGRMNDAIDQYTKCLGIDQQNKAFNAKIYCNRATALSQINRYEEAIRDCDKAIYYDHGYAKAYLRKAACLKALGTEEKLEQALRVYEQASKLVGNGAQRDIQQNIRETKLELKKAKRKDYYKILGVTQSANEHEIKKAYRKSALKYHPDRHASKSDTEKKEAEVAFKNLGEAYAVLSDPQKKQRYDAGVDLEDLDNEYAQPGGGMGGVDPQQIFQMFFGGGGMGGMGGGNNNLQYNWLVILPIQKMSLSSKNANCASEKRLKSSLHCSNVNHYSGCTVSDDSFQISRIKLSEIDPKLFFERYIATRTPVVLEGALADPGFSALKKWESNEYLDTLSGEELVQVEYRANEMESFGRGRETQMSFHSFLQLVERGDTLHYLTTQDVEEGESGRPELMAPFVQRLRNDFPIRPALMGNLIPQNINVWMGHARNGASSGLHHDYHDNMYILLRGKKSFRLYSPADAERLYTRGKLAFVHENGRINYEGEITTAYGADPSSEAAAIAAMEKEEAEWALSQAEKALENGKIGAKEAFEKAEIRFEAAMDAILSAEFGDESDQEGENHSRDDLDESDAPIDTQAPEITSSPESLPASKHRKVDRTLVNPLNFSKIDASLMQDSALREEVDTLYPEFQHARAAFCEVSAGDILYLPASWFHEVRSFGSSNGHLALNYWFHPPDQLSNFQEPYSSQFWKRNFLSRGIESNGDVATTENVIKRRKLREQIERLFSKYVVSVRNECNPKDSSFVAVFAAFVGKDRAYTSGCNERVVRLQGITSPFSRSDVTFPFSWAYVKRHQLQHPNDGRIIRPNDEMKRTFGIDNEIHFNQVAKLLTQHLQKWD